MSFGYHGDDGNIFCENEEEAFCPEKPFKRGIQNSMKAITFGTSLRSPVGLVI